MRTNFLRKALGRTETKALLRDLMHSLNIQGVVCDLKGVPVDGVPPLEPVFREEILWNGKVIGAVVADKPPGLLLKTIQYFLAREAETRALITETLGHYRELAILNEIGEIMNSSLELSEVTDLVMTKARRFIPGDNGSIMLLNEESEQFEIIGAFGAKADVPVAFKAGTGIVGTVVENGKGEIVNEVGADPRYLPGGPYIQALACVPLKVRDRVIGVINISSETPVPYTSNHLSMLQTLASEVATAIENANLYNRLRETFYSTVYTLAETIERRDSYTGGHTRRVMDFCLGMAEELGLDKAELSDIKLIAILHDIGKIGVSDLILQKPGKLTAAEFELMKSHAAVGSEILANIKELRRMIPGIRHHHERFDGLGYPDGLSGLDIPLSARIVAVADTFDAMTSDRPYRNGLKPEVAFEELLRCSGSQFDPEMVRVFLCRFGDAYGFAPQRND